MRALQSAGLATLLADLLTVEEEAADRHTDHLRFDIDLLGDRVVGLIDWARTQTALRDLPIGLFGASNRRAPSAQSSY
ncbi:MAG TPA: hypothetical protein VFZ93_14335 [Albitalea sp.]